MSSPHYAPPPLLLSIPDCLCSWPCSLPARRRKRRRGRRGGLDIKLKRFLRLHREPQLQLGFHAEGLAGKHFIHWRSLEPVDGWIISVFSTSAAPLPVIRSPRFWRGGVCTDHLRSLPRANSSMDYLEYTPRLRMALINARSVVNKTFIIKILLKKSQEHCTNHWITIEATQNTPQITLPFTQKLNTL